NPTIAWSPDAKMLALTRRGDLTIRSIDGSEVSTTKIQLDGRIPAAAGNPMWLRDSKTLVQGVRDIQGMLHFHRVNVQTGEMKEVMATGSASGSLQSFLSPDEKTIYSNGSGTKTMSPAIYAYSVATGEKKLVFSANDDGVVPGLALSPDGRTL